MIRAHVDAVLALVDAVSGVTVYDGTVPDSPSLPYVVIRTDSGRRERSALPVSSDRVTVRIWATSVGVTRASAQWVSEKVTTALLERSRSAFRDPE